MAVDSARVVSVLGIAQTVADRVLPVAQALVDEYGRGSIIPEAITDEATLRCIGWLVDHPASGVSVSEVGDVKFSFSSMKGALRASGAMGLMSPFKSRRAC